MRRLPLSLAGAIFAALNPWQAAQAQAQAQQTRQAHPPFPLVVNTWGGPFTAATDAAFASLLASSGSATAALDAVEAGCSACEAARCDGTVGYGGSPDENCETTLDAMLMDGTTMGAGAVGGLRRVRNAVGVARRVLDHTRHTLLVGDLATAFAVAEGFVEEDLGTADSRASCREWIEGGCLPNFRVGGGVEGCGGREDMSAMLLLPLSEPSPGLEQESGIGKESQAPSHDTISMIAIDASGAMAAGTSTNGAAHKVPGRVGDGPIVGSGSYVDGDVGGCGATGDGDVMMRFLPCYQAVENLRLGMTPVEAAEDAVRRMVRRAPGVKSGVVVVDKDGRHGGAASGWRFTYSFRGGGMAGTEVVNVEPVDGLDGDRRTREMGDL